MRRFILFLMLFLAVISLAFQQYARRLLPVWTTPLTPCVEGSIYYHMLDHKPLICKNTGIVELGSGTGSGTIPEASATVTGLLKNTDWVIFNNKQNALGFTPENVANKNAPSGYAGLIGGKVSITTVEEVISSINLTDYSTSSGTGTTAIKSTISGAAEDDVLTWNGTNWINSSPAIVSVFDRSGIVVAQAGDYNASQVTNAFVTNIANVLTNVSAPSNPSAGSLAIWADVTDTILKVKDSSGTVAVTVRPNTCSGTDKVSAISSAGIITCTPDQGGAGAGVITLNTLTSSDQTFAAVDDTNINLGVSSVTDTHTFSVAWVGTLAKARMVATTVHTDQTNTFGAFAQTFQAGTLFNLVDPTTTSKVARFDLSNISAASTRTVNIPDANSTTVQSSTAPSNQFASSISAQGVVGYSQPSFNNLSGSATDAQIPDNISHTAIPNLTSNGFVKTSGGNGTLSIDTNTYLTTNQTITLSGDVTGSGTTSITTTITDNSVDGTDIALGSDAQGDIMFYNGTDWARLAAGTSGNILQTNGAGANPTWVTPGAGSGDMILSAVQTVTGAKTFDPAKLIVGSVASDPAVVISGFYRDTDDGKLYWGVDSAPDFWGEVFVSGLSAINLASANVTGVLGTTNGGLGVVLSDPNADRILFWDDSAGQYQFLTLGTNLSITGTTINASGGGGSGDVVGPASATDNAVVRFDSTTGKLVQDSAVTIADTTGNISSPGNLSLGVGSSVAGNIELVQGTAPSLGTTSAIIYAPTSVTSYAIVLPSAAFTGLLKVTNSSNVMTMAQAVAGTDYTTPSSAETFTNKTFDVEGTGNLFTIPKRILLEGAACNGTTAFANFDLPTTGAPTASCSGTTTTVGTLDFVDGSTIGATRKIKLPPTFTGNIDITLIWFANSTSTNAVRWSVSTGCVADSEAMSTGPSYNTASVSNEAYVGGTAFFRDITTFLNVAKTNCAADETMWTRVERIGGDGGDTLAATALLESMEITIRTAE